MKMPGVSSKIQARRKGEKLMPKRMFGKSGWRLSLLLILPGLALAQAMPVAAMQGKEARATDLRLAQSGDRACAERCVAQCRAALAQCESAGNSNCRAQFQICARRCVVTCGSG